MIIPAVARRGYNAVALFALLNMIGLVVVGAYLCAVGVLSGERLSRVAAALRGEMPIEPAPTGSEPTEQGATEKESKPTEDALAESQMSLEIMRREADRIKEDLRQQLALANSIMIRVTAEREAHQQEVEERAGQGRAAAKESAAEGFKKELDILKGLKPKVAAEHLLSMKDPDEAASILLAMDTRSAKKIVGAARSAEQVTQMREILWRMRRVAPERSGELEIDK